MSELYRSIMTEMAGQIGDIAREIGTDEETAAGAVGTAVPLMLGGLSRLASGSDEGALALFDALEDQEEDEDKGFFGSMASLLTSPLQKMSRGRRRGRAHCGPTSASG